MFVKNSKTLIVLKFGIHKSKMDKEEKGVEFVR